MSFYLGAYAASPNVSGWDPQLEAAYYQQLKSLESVRGLEHPFLGSLHAQDDQWFLQHIDTKWDFVFTTIPGVMNALATLPTFGLASTDEAGREAAIAFMRQANHAIAKLNTHLKRQAVTAIMLHSAPARHNCAGSAAAFKTSMQTLLSWDWHGARLLVEHCDALIDSHAPSKGFLSLTDELSVLSELNATQAPEHPLGVVINWGRSVLETRQADGALQHIVAAKAQGLLAGVMFSGISDQATEYGAWRDSHQPAQTNELVAFGEPGSWLTEQAVADTLQACQGVNLAVLGLKIGIRPQSADLTLRLNYLRAQLGMLQRQVALCR
ncbi:DUF4862 family protein [Rheinheimera sp. UJ51]|uniref:DUF4862 family protein n=1 Tax=Rheinheimera sp. UJ51 TaxID=2892446 RepID=UPI001E50BBD5|nr:DUF4862 family protein [Rheinheimera sp. UJ51]MCC5450730.1 DUF4862 family protein [Rheinheimera sp. UJ51]